MGIGFSTTYSLSAPYVSASATNMPRVSPSVSSLNSTETFSDLVRRFARRRLPQAMSQLVNRNIRRSAFAVADVKESLTAQRGWRLWLSLIALSLSWSVQRYQL